MSNVINFPNAETTAAQPIEHYNVGDRVVITRNDRHGTVIESHSVTYRTTSYGSITSGLTPQKEEITVRWFHQVRTDAGYVFSSEYTDALEPETERPTYIYPDPLINDRPELPERVWQALQELPRNIAYSEEKRDRARKAENKRSWQRDIDMSKASLEKYRAIWQAWSSNHPNQNAVKEITGEAEAERKRQTPLDQLSPTDRGHRWIEENKPSWAKSVIIARLQEDESDLHTDYYGSRTVKTVVLAWSAHTTDRFDEMRRAAEKYPETKHLATAKAEDVEQREKHAMGAGYYLGFDRHSGWQVRKTSVDSVITAIGNGDHVLDQPDTAANTAPTMAACNGVTISHNAEKNGIELIFADKPDDATREQIKALGFKWSKFQKLWYAGHSDRLWQTVQSIFGQVQQSEPEPTEPEPPAELSQASEPEPPTPIAPTVLNPTIHTLTEPIAIKSIAPAETEPDTAEHDTHQDDLAHTQAQLATALEALNKVKALVALKESGGYTVQPHHAVWKIRDIVTPVIESLSPKLWDGTPIDPIATEETEADEPPTPQPINWLA